MVSILFIIGAACLLQSGCTGQTPKTQVSGQNGVKGMGPDHNPYNYPLQESCYRGNNRQCEEFYYSDEAKKIRGENTQCAQFERCDHQSWKAKCTSKRDDTIHFTFYYYNQDDLDYAETQCQLFESVYTTNPNISVTAPNNTPPSPTMDAQYERDSQGRETFRISTSLDTDSEGAITRCSEYWGFVSNESERNHIPKEDPCDRSGVIADCEIDEYEDITFHRHFCYEGGPGTAETPPQCAPCSEDFPGRPVPD